MFRKKKFTLKKFQVLNYKRERERERERESESVNSSFCFFIVSLCVTYSVPFLHFNIFLKLEQLKPDYKKKIKKLSDRIKFQLCLLLLLFNCKI